MLGAVVERLSYDAWGKRRFANGQDDPSGSIASQTTRGFTGHEELADVGLVHMNGRVYDPLLGRFGSPDPMTVERLPWGQRRFANGQDDPSGSIASRTFTAALNLTSRYIPIAR